MRRLLSATAILTGTLILAGCATTGIGTYAVKSLDTARYLTWDWGAKDALPTGDARLDNNEIFQDHLMGAVERGLAAQGLPRADEGTLPDLLVHYHATVDRRTVIHESERAFGTYQQYSGTGVEVHEFEEYTLVLDVVDARTNRLLWRGWAEDALDNVIRDQDRLERQVEAGVRRLMEHFPFGRQPRQRIESE